jgi:hypothetical protein
MFSNFWQRLCNFRRIIALQNQVGYALYHINPLYTLCYKLQKISAG